jgi:hypothetical protein
MPPHEDTGQSYQETARRRQQGSAGPSEPDVPNADLRKDYVDAVWDAALPQMVNVGLRS